MLDDQAVRLAADIFVQVTSGRILRDGTTSTHSPHDAAAALEAARAFMRAAADYDMTSAGPERRQMATYGLVGSELAAS